MSKFLILPVLAATLVIAQQAPVQRGPRAGAHRASSFDSIKAYLNLSDSQVTSIRDAGRSSKDSSRAAAKELRVKHEALQQLLNSGSTDVAAIGRANLEIRDLRKQLEANMAKIREQALSFLSAEQKAKLATLEQSKDLRRELREAYALHLLAPAAGAAGHRFGGPGRMHRAGKGQQ